MYLHMLHEKLNSFFLNIPIMKEKTKEFWHVFNQKCVRFQRTRNYEEREEKYCHILLCSG